MTAHGRTARLSALLARERRVGVIFRRGPSKLVRLIRWNLARDMFEPGQWLKGRVYESSSDLSPDGALLCYDAAPYRGAFPTYTAVSKPPFFTALALWPRGDGSGGGGLFENRRRLQLSHEPGPSDRELALAPGFRLPRGFVAEPYRGLEPIAWVRLERDGWKLEQAGRRAPGRSVRLRYAEPLILRKALAAGLSLLWSEHGRFERDGRGSIDSARIVDGAGATVLEIGRVDWADADRNGDALWAWAGVLWRLRIHKLRGPAGAPQILGDFNDMRFEPIEPTKEAARW